MYVSCLFFNPEVVSKHSVSLWIGYSGYLGGWSVAIIRDGKYFVPSQLKAEQLINYLLWSFLGKEEVSVVLKWVIKIFKILKILG